MPCLFLWKDTKISIHALLTESDRPGDDDYERLKNFNPRSPHGERLEVINNLETARGFQSTLSSRRATPCSGADGPHTV